MISHDLTEDRLIHFLMQQLFSLISEAEQGTLYGTGKYQSLDIMQKRRKKEREREFSPTKRSPNRFLTHDKQDVFVINNISIEKFYSEPIIQLWISSSLNKCAESLYHRHSCTRRI